MMNSVLRGPFHVLGTILLSVAAVIALVVIVLAWLNLLPAASNTLTLIAASVWPVLAPILLLAALVATLVAVPFLFSASRGIPTRIVAILALVAVASAGFITWRIADAATAHGGSVNFAEALTITGGEKSAAGTSEVYATVDGTPLTAVTYRPKKIDGAPVIVYLHGGGWVSGSPQDVKSAARWYTDRGWLVVSAGYRLATDTSATWNKAPADVACALTWAVAEARKSGADASRLVLMGDSAGGNLALVTAWSAAQNKATSSCASAGPVPVPNAVVVGYPVANPADTYANGQRWFRGEDPQAFTRKFLGGTPAQHPDRLAAISPITFAGPGVPPTLIVQPTRDDFIPASGNRSFAADARAHGATVDVYDVPFSHHAFDIAPRSIGGQVKLTDAEAWLKAQGLWPTP